MESILNYLLALTEDKHSKLQQILDITRTQTALLQAENVEALEQQLDSKQLVMDQIDQLDSHINESERRLRVEHESDLASLAGNSTAQRIMGRRASIDELVRTAIELDRHNAEQSQRLLEKLKQEMQENQRANQAANAYMRSNTDGTQHSLFTNRKL